MHKALHPCLYQIKTRVWLTELARALGRPATLDDVPDAEHSKKRCPNSITGGIIT